ncbi:MAG TPA: ROK family protein [Caldilineaceae bacterium]|nr:ROK family protein [Caldilineaceae bacterium]
MSALSNDYALAIDIGGTKIAAALVNRQGSVVQRLVRPTRADLGAHAILQNVIEIGRDVVAAARRFDLPVAAVGIGSAGQVNVETGAISYASQNLPGWSGLPLADQVRDALHLEVFVDNDVNTLALGEHRFGAGRGFREALYVAVGTGVGGALVRNGDVWRGATWSAGEICHLVIDVDGTRRCSCGATGHLEAYTSGPAMVLRYRELSGSRDAPDLQSVAERARQGDGHALQAIAEGAKILGTTLAGLLNVLDPELLVVGGGVTELGRLWWRHFEDALRANPMPGPAQVTLRPAQLGSDAVLAGAAWLAFDGLARSGAQPAL